MHLNAPGNLHDEGNCPDCKLEAKQEACDHQNFKDSKCEFCNLTCEHWEVDDGYCLDCGEFILKDLDPPDDYGPSGSFRFLS